MAALYNENDPKAAATLRELIHQGFIAPGDVDERSIRDVRAADLRGYDQFHAFAGFGIWSLALRTAGWPDDRPVWTGSCPCQPFSAAGKQLGFSDPRHLWPDWFALIAERRPDRVFGEQAPTAGAWIDLVSGDMEGLGYAFGAPDIPAAGFGGAHIRQRFYWVADAHDAERWADLAPRNISDWPATGRVESYGELRTGGDVRGLADAAGARHPWSLKNAEGAPRHEARVRLPCVGGEFIPLRDGSWRPVESGTLPLAYEDPERLGRLRGCGNALDHEQATSFIGAYLKASEALSVPMQPQREVA